MSLLTPKPCPLCPEKDATREREIQALTEAHARELAGKDAEVTFLREFLASSGTIVRNLAVVEKSLEEPAKDAQRQSPAPGQDAGFYRNPTMWVDPDAVIEVLDLDDDDGSGH